MTTGKTIALTRWTFVDRAGVNKLVIECAIKVGLFREMYPNRKDLLNRYQCGDFRDTLFGASLSTEERLSDEVPDYKDQMP